MNNFLLAIAGLIIATFAAAFAVPYFLDWNDYRSQIEERVSGLVGRKVKIDGDINMRLLPLPFLDLKKVRVLDTFPGAKKPFIEVDTFTLWLSAPSLLSGNIEARKMELIRPVVNFVVDARGRGNWEEFDKKKGPVSGLSLRNIALQDVHIEQGKVVFHSLVNQGNQIFETPMLNGRMSAHSLSGPYKFRGHLGAVDGERISVNFSTGRSDDKDGMPLQAFLKDLASGASYQFNSRVMAVTGGKMSYKGKLTAKIPFERLFLDRQSLHKAGSPGRKEPLEITSDLSGTATRARLENIIFSLVRKNRPQALKGVVQLDWSHGDLQAVGNFNSRLLDIDLMGSNIGSGFNVSELLAGLPGHIYGLGEKFHRADFTLKLNQIQAGGEIIRNLETTLSKTKSGLKVSGLTARLPAASYLSLSGEIAKEPSQEPTFTGPFLVQGQDIGRLKNWLMSSKDKGGLHKPFIFASEVIIGKGKVRLTDIEADLAGDTIYGEVIQESGQDKSLVVNLDFVSLDIARLTGEDISLEDMVRNFTGQGDKKTALSLLGDSTVEGLEQKKAKISLRVGRLKLKDTVLHDFKTSLNFGAGKFSSQKLSFSSKEGLKVVLDGEIFSEKMQAGQKLNLRLESQKPSGVFQLVSYLNLTDSFTKNDKRLEMLHPVVLNIGITQEGNQKGQALLINGQAAGSELFAYGSLKADQDNKNDNVFTDSDLDLKISVSNPDGPELLKQLVTDLAGENMAGIGKGEGILNIKLSGIPTQGMQTEIYGALPGLKLSALGKIRVEKGRHNFSGPVSLESENMSQGLALLGLGIQMRPDAGGLEIKGKLVKQDALYQLSEITGKVGKADIFGSARLEHGSDMPILELKLTSTTASLVSVLEPGIDWFGKRKKLAGGGEQSADNIWTDRRFDLSLLHRFKGSLELKTKEMEIGKGLMVKDAVLKATYGDGKFVVEKLDGQAFGGSLHLSVAISHGRAVTAVKGSLEISNASLEKIFPEHSNALATGKAELALDFSGSGLSPRGILNLLKGSGKLQLIDTQFNYLAPSAIRETAKDELAGVREDGKSFRQHFLEHLSAGQFSAGTRRLDVSIQDGIISVANGNFEDDNTRLYVKPYLSLINLGIDSEWKLSAVKKIGSPDLPPVTLQFSGKLENFGEITPSYRLKSLESFLSVMKIEKDVQRLEEINSKLEKAAEEEKNRREEEARRQAERKRQQLEEAENLAGSQETLETLPLADLPVPLAAQSQSQGVQIEPLSDLP